MQIDSGKLPFHWLSLLENWPMEDYVAICTKLVRLFVKRDSNSFYLYSNLAHILNDVYSPFLIQTFLPICFQSSFPSTLTPASIIFGLFNKSHSNG